MASSAAAASSSGASDQMRGRRSSSGDSCSMRCRRAIRQAPAPGDGSSSVAEMRSNAPAAWRSTVLQTSSTVTATVRAVASSDTARARSAAPDTSTTTVSRATTCALVADRGPDPQELPWPAGRVLEQGGVLVDERVVDQQGVLQVGEAGLLPDLVEHVGRRRGERLGVVVTDDVGVGLVVDHPQVAADEEHHGDRAPERPVPGLAQRRGPALEPAQECLVPVDVGSETSRRRGPALAHRCASSTDKGRPRGAPMAQ